MPDSTLANLTAATAATGGLFYGTQSGVDKKFTSTAAGAALIEATDAAAQRSLLSVLPLSGGTLTGTLTGTTFVGALTGTASGNLVAGGALGTPSSGTLTNCTNIPAANLTGTIDTARLPATITGLTSVTSTTFVGALTGTASGNLVAGGALGTPSSGTLTSCTGLPLSTGVTGTLPIAKGGTGQTTAVAAFDALAPTTTKGDLIVHNGTDNIRVAVGGTNGHVLTVDSAEASGVKWAASGGGGGGGSSDMVLLASATASSSADITFDNEFDSSVYASYELRFQGIRPATDNVNLLVQLRTSAPANITDTYRIGRYATRIDANGSGPLSNVSATTGYTIAAGAGSGTNKQNSGIVSIIPFSGDWTSIIAHARIAANAGDRYSTTLAGDCEGTTAPAGVKLYFSTGNIASGTAQLYGIKK